MKESAVLFVPFLFSSLWACARLSHPQLYCCCSCPGPCGLRVAQATIIPQSLCPSAAFACAHSPPHRPRALLTSPPLCCFWPPSLGPPHLTDLSPSLSDLIQAVALKNIYLLMTPHCVCPAQTFPWSSDVYLWPPSLHLHVVASG